MPARVRSFLFLIAIYIAFFASGASSLIAEVTWNRMLIVVVGNSLSATAMILVVFMGGLGLGSFVGGRFFGRRKASLIPYLVLELCIGAYVLLSPTLFDLLADFFTGLADSMENRLALSFVRVVVSMAALLLPAFLMGATFPAIISGAAPQSASKRTARTGYLYSINTLGAAMGTFAAGYHLLFEFGVQFTLNVAFVLYLVAALCAFVAHTSRRGDVVEEEMPAADTSGDMAARSPRWRFLAIATFGIGFVALSYEVILTRLGILYLGNSVSVFPLVLTGFLLGTGISAIGGTWLYGVLRRRGGSGEKLFGVLALLSGLFVLLTPYLLLSDWVIDIEQYARLADAMHRNPLPILGIIIAPTVLVGALLPVAIRMMESGRRGEATRSAATLYALNTVGGLLGAALINHYLVPWIGMQGALTILTAICVGIGISALPREGGILRRSVITVASVVLLSLLAMALPRVMDLYAAKLAESTRAAETEVLFAREGRAAMVTVLDQSDPKRGSYRDMYLNGVEEASTRYWHVQLFKLLGVLPVLVHEDTQDKDVLVIAFGAGITAGSALASERVGSLDVVDLNPDIENINDLFTEVNGDVFHDPRFHFHNDDGRNYLVTSGKKYDAILGDSTHPRAYDSWILYTEEFYAAVKQRLKPGGIFAQWVPVLGSMRGELMRIHLNTFQRAFPHSTLWYIYGSDQAFLMSTPEPFELDIADLEAQLDSLPDWFQAEHYQLDTAARVAGFFWLDPTTMTGMIGPETRINTDDRHYFDKQSVLRGTPPHWQLPRFQARIGPYLVGGDEELNHAVHEQQRVASHLAHYGFFHSMDELHRAYCLMPANGNVQFWMAREYLEELPDHETFCQSEEIKQYRAMVGQDPNNYLALNALADLLAAEGNLDEALPLVEKAISLDPDNGMIQDTQGWILFKRGRLDEALTVLRDADRNLAEHPIINYHLGVVLQARGEGTSAAHHLRMALDLSADFPGSDDARRRLEILE